MKKLSFQKSLTSGLLAAGAATVVNVVLFLIFKSLNIITDDIFIQPGQPMGIVPIAISSIVPTLLASIVYFLLDKYTANGFKIFQIISLVLLIASFANPFLGIPNVTVPYAIALNTMHVVVVVFLLLFIGRARKS